ncbi:MAG: amidohydrolase [Oscillospiraceae bacterium]|nr:amidohydrolase [Oscillospiraceae bacterium]
MKIDFHTHSFNEKVAEKAISNLEVIADIKPFTRGLVSQTIERMDEWGINKAVLLPIATKPTQQTIINDWSKEQNSGRIIAFGSVHPDADDAFSELERIKEMGLKGVKLHPDYQGFDIDEERLFPLYKKIAELGLVCVFHAGYDCYSPNHVHAKPEASARVHKAVPELKMVLAHLGGYQHWDDVYTHIAGLDGEIYLDTSMCAGYISDELFVKIIRKHGVDRILLASDCPWCSAGETVKLIERVGFSEEEKEMIYHKNAEKLLGIG